MTNPLIHWFGLAILIIVLTPLVVTLGSMLGWW